MLLASLVLFAVAAVGGATLAVMRLTNRPLPLALALGHGAIAAAGLVVLIVAVVGAAAVGTMLTAALVLFVIAAIGGFTLLSFHLRKKSLPIPLMLGHGGAAVVAFLVLLSQVIGGS
jgi:hypothetical protein